MMQVNPETHPALAGCVDAGRRCQQLARLLDSTQFSKSLEGHDSIGSHMRHCLDYFGCLIRGLELGEIDYDARERDPRTAADPETFMQRMGAAVDALILKATTLVSKRLKLTQTVTESGAVLTVETTLDRELVFLSGHCVHHLAIASLLAKMMGVEVSPDIGMGYSTAVHRRAAAPRD